MNQELNYYEFCDTLVTGFQEALEAEGIDVLYQNYLLLNEGKSNIGLTAFKQRELRGSIVNQLLGSEYAEYFVNLTEAEMAKLLRMEVKRFNAYYKQISRKLSSLRIRGFKEELLDMKNTMEEITYVMDNDPMEVDNG